MANAPTYRRCGFLLLALAFVWSGGLYAPYAAAQDRPPAATPSALAMAKYRQDLAAYLQARDAYQAAAKTYWSSITEKRRSRNGMRARGAALSIDDYVLDQPPVYSGPPKPRDPSKPPEPPQPPPYVPVVADFLAAAVSEFKFTPRTPRNDGEFKRAYVAAAAAAGLSKDQVVRIYSFEATGNGTYDLEAGLEYNKTGRAITTALGYNQLLATNSVEILAENGDRFIAKLAATAQQLPDSDQKALEKKLAIVRKMIAFAKSVSDDWNEHEILARTQKGLAIHALNLDLGFGPLLQTQKLLDSIVFARRKGFTVPLSAAELEMMNLTGDGNGFDMVTMPANWRDKVPTANFFQPHGYADNPVVQRNNVVAKLLAATDAVMDNEVKKPGAKELTADFP
ncbi:MAG TPA: hypothetical protein VK591_18555 [Xanthobacteraceae bacterium]|nr:hypothetical protein [Xanthobacteraceae bacterium]